MNPGVVTQDSAAGVQVETAPVAVTPAAPVEEQPQAVAAPETDPEPAADEVAVAESEEGLVPIKANITSVFYRRPSPEEPAFVELGDEVKADSVICLLEVMKCFRQVMAETPGRIAKICVESNSLVEDGTVLFLIRPE
jgi:acetyl-CoA carboxylase biotin carboxyl carrier protein